MNPTQKKPGSWVLFVFLVAGAVVALACLGVILVLSRWGGTKTITNLPTVVQEILPLQVGQATQAPTQTSAPVESSAVQPETPQAAVLTELNGLVEIRGEDGNWMSIQANALVQAHQQLQTGDLSSIILSFYDGSELRLGPNSQLAIDELDANKNGPRTVKLTLLIGESEHLVAASNDPASRFEVNTPSGQVLAKNARFHITVDPTKFVRFDAIEGAVDVSNFGSRLTIVAGQSTTCGTGLAPSGPFFRETGEGRVELVGASWRIAGSTFHTNAHTITSGNPQAGDWVKYDSLVQLDGTRMVYRISLMQREQKNQLELRGIVDEMTPTGWVVSGNKIQVNEVTLIDPAIQVGEVVRVIGKILPQKTLVATRIYHAVDLSNNSFEITGVVQAISDTTWIISDTPIWVDGATVIEAGIVSGSVVHAQGQIQETGIRLAQNIRQAVDEGREFAFTGQVESVKPWRVPGINFETDDSTLINSRISPGDLVRVYGRILENGHWLAQNINLLEDVSQSSFDYWGAVNDTDPWVVAGIPLTVDANTILQGKLVISRMVHVKGIVNSGNTWLAQSMVGQDLRQGCLGMTSAIRQIKSNQVVLFNFQPIRLSGGVTIQGELKEATVVLVSGCVGEDGAFSVSNVVAISQLDVLPRVQP